QEPRKPPRVVDAVVHDEHARVLASDPRERRLGGRTPGGRPLEGRQPDGELAAPAGAFAGGGDDPAVPLDELLDERPADPEPPRPPAGGAPPGPLGARRWRGGGGGPAGCPVPGSGPWWPPGPRARGAGGVSSPPASVYFAALVRRLTSPCSGRMGSAWSCSPP